MILESPLNNVTNPKNRSPLLKNIKDDLKDPYIFCNNDDQFFGFVTFFKIFTYQIIYKI